MKLEIHNSALKNIKKTSLKIKQKIEKLVSCVMVDDFKNCPFPIKPLKGKYKIYNEILIDQDYRVIYRIENNTFFLRYAGTHNQLGTG